MNGTSTDVALGLTIAPQIGSLRSKCLNEFVAVESAWSLGDEQEFSAVDVGFIRTDAGDLFSFSLDGRESWLAASFHTYRRWKGRVDVKRS